MSKSRVENRVAQIRKGRGISASDIARRVHVSRQTIYSIEAGTYVPNTELALLIARELEVSIDELFSLSGDSPASPNLLTADVLSATPPVEGQPVRTCQVGTRWIGIPVSATPYYIPEADGIIKRPSRTAGRADLAVFSKPDPSSKRLILAGCDPASRILSSMVERDSGVEVVSAGASSKLALSWLKENKVHVAGSHLEDPKTGEFNIPYIREEFPENDVFAITFAHWEEGFVVAPGNPKKIETVADLIKRGVRFVNREPGSGSRALFEKLVGGAGIPGNRIQGHDHIAFGHLAAAYYVLSHDADVCIATRSAAQTFGLHFIPVHSARYDFVIRRKFADLPAVKALLDVLQRATLRRKLEVLAGYETSQTGSLVA